MRTQPLWSFLDRLQSPLNFDFRSQSVGGFLDLHRHPQGRHVSHKTDGTFPTFGWHNGRRLSQNVAIPWLQFLNVPGIECWIFLKDSGNLSFVHVHILEGMIDSPNDVVPSLPTQNYSYITFLCSFLENKRWAKFGIGGIVP